MRSGARQIISVLFIACFALNISAKTADQTIKLDRENHLLIAPDARSYQWYLNGELIDETGKTVNIESPGTYRVVLTSPEGGQTAASMSVGINEDGEVYTIYLIGD